MCLPTSFKYKSSLLLKEFTECESFELGLKLIQKNGVLCIKLSYLIYKILNCYPNFKSKNLFNYFTSITLNLVKQNGHVLVVGLRFCQNKNPLIFTDTYSVITSITFEAIYYHRLFFEVLNVTLEWKQFLYSHESLMSDYDVYLWIEFLLTSFKFITMFYCQTYNVISFKVWHKDTGEQRSQSITDCHAVYLIIVNWNTWTKDGLYHRNVVK